MKIMRSLSVSSSIRLAVVLSLSFTTYSFSSKPKSFVPLSFSSFTASAQAPKATACDVLSLLGTKEQASIVDPDETQELWSCFKFLVPFHPLSSINSVAYVKRRSMSSDSSFSRKGKEKEKENQMIWWPPESVMELARLAFNSGGDPDVIYRALDPSINPVPDVEGSQKCKCQLTRTPYGRQFISEELNAYLKFLFEMIASRGPSVGLNVSLSRYDFFHGHLFLARDTGRLGILFHAKEYPAYDKETFPLNMGYCQRGSNVVYDNTMNLRNILWMSPLPSNSSKAWVAPGVLVVLDARPGGIIYRDLIPHYVQIARTLYEDDFGEPVVDVNYLNVGSTSPNYQIFIC